MIPAKETRYKNTIFRSRLEARWAIFLDSLHIPWQYEAHSFRFSNHTGYLPDFWFPTAQYRGRKGLYGEVKPEGGDLSKPQKLCLETGNMVWILQGMPHLPPYKIYVREGKAVKEMCYDLEERRGDKIALAIVTANNMYFG